MKKEYVVPAVRTVEAKGRLSLMLASDPSTLTTVVGDTSNKIGDGETVGAKSGSLWDDEEDQ